MNFQSPGPILLELGSLTIRWYGVLTAAAFLLALSFGQKLLLKRQALIKDKEIKKINEDDFSNFAFTVLIAGLMGARLWFVFLNLDYFMDNPMEIPQIWLGGQSIQGGIVGALVGTWIFNRQCWLFLASTTMAVVPLAQALGRWGNFFNEEAYGAVTELPWKLYISYTGEYHHPTFLYEMLWNLMAFGILWFFALRYPAAHQKIIGLYLVLYSVGRLLIEPLRMDSLMLGAFPAASVLGILGVVIGIIVYRTSPSSV